MSVHVCSCVCIDVAVYAYIYIHVYAFNKILNCKREIKNGRLAVQDVHVCL